MKIYQCCFRVRSMVEFPYRRGVFECVIIRDSRIASCFICGSFRGSYQSIVRDTVERVLLDHWSSKSNEHAISFVYSISNL